MKPHVFISYRHHDREVALQLRTVLETEGVSCWIDSSNLYASEHWDESVARAITESWLLILLITAGSIESPRQQKRELTIAERYQVPVIPVYVVPRTQCRAFEYLLATTQYFDASQPPLLDRFDEVATEARRVFHARDLARLRGGEKAPSSPPPEPATARPVPLDHSPTEKGLDAGGATDRSLSIVLLYRRGIEADERLLLVLREHLQKQGHSVFIDRDLNVGFEWRNAIRSKIENADAVIPLISMFSVGSEMLEEEVKIAGQRFECNGAKPRLLPVRVNYEGMLPAGLARYLQRLQYVLWRSPSDDEVVTQAVVNALGQPPPPTATRQMEMPLGAVPLTSPFYIVREGDRIFQSAVARRESIVLVKGARQMGKTSLIARGLQRAREEQRRIAITDLQTLNESDFSDLRTFYVALGDRLAEQLGLEAEVEAGWNPRRAANVNFERFLRREVLGEATTPLVWALDEVDRLFPCSFGTEVFGLFRSWHNARALDPASPWGQLSLVIGFATEASLFIRDVNMSPFNVGTSVAVADFHPGEVAELSTRYGQPLRGERDVQRLMECVGGQPFLVRRSLFALAVEEVPLDKLLAEAATDLGVFGDHLRRFSISLHRDPELETAMRRFLLQGSELSLDHFHRLRSAGLIVGEARQEAKVRCGVYRDYLRRRFA